MLTIQSEAQRSGNETIIHKITGNSNIILIILISFFQEVISMDKYIFDKTNGLWYELHGDYYLPCVTSPKRKPVGIFGNRYRKHLKQHKNPFYTAMLLAGALEDHVAEINWQA